MSQPLRVLLVEDSESDALLVLRALERAGFAPSHERVCDPSALTAALEREVWDVVLSDFSMPQFTGLDAVRVVRASHPILPFILISGTVGEEVAVEAMRLGANDYMMKDSLTRLGAAIRRELETATVQRDRAASARRVEHLDRVLRAAREVDGLIVRERDPTRLIDAACECLVRRRGYEAAWIAVTGADGAVGQHFAEQGFGIAFNGLRRRLERGAPPPCCQRTMEAGTVLVVEDPQSECPGDCPALVAETTCCRQAAMAMFAPLSSDGQTYGLMCVAVPPGLDTDDEEAALLLQVADDLAFALHAVEAEAASLAAMSRTEALLEAARAVLHQPDFEGAARAIFDVCARHLGAPAGYVALRSQDQEHNEVLFLEAGGMVCAVDPGAPMPIRGLRARAYQQGQPLFDNAFASGPHWALMPQGHLALKSVLFAPLMLDGEAVGLMGLANKPGGFDAQDAQLAGALAEVAAIALREHRTRQELRESEERLRALFGSMADYTMMLDREHRVQMINRVEQGLSQEAVLGQPLHSFVAPDDRARVKAALDAVVQGGPPQHYDTSYVRPDGETVHFSSVVAPIVLSGEIAGSVVSSRDMTERRALEAQVAQSDRLASMGLLAAGVAHEINNPLSYVLYNLESLTSALQQRDAGQTPQPSALDELGERLDDALEGTRRIREIARGLSTFSRVEEDRLTPVDLRQVIEVAINMAFTEIKYRARLVKDFAEAPPVMASEGRLSQVFLNLLINAAHAVEEGAAEANEIRVRTWAEGGVACAEVRDTGVGIAPEQIGRLFEPFFTTKQVGVGSGLGLAISKNIVSDYGGTIEVQSTLGQGTRFVVRIPPRSGAPAEDEVPSRSSAALDLRARGRILIVDDEAKLRQALARMLQDHDVVEAADGAGAQQILQRDPDFDVVLCDMMMPEVTGMDLHRWLETTNPDLAERLIFITGGAFTPRARAYLAQVDNLRLEKPFAPANLKKIVNELVRARGAQAGAGAGAGEVEEAGV